MRQQLLRPSADVATIRGRQEASNFFVDHDDVLSGVVGHLRRVPDLDRVLNRLVSLQVIVSTQRRNYINLYYSVESSNTSCPNNFLVTTS